VSHWGEEIYTTSVSDDELPVLWNGVNDDGAEAASGSYFYHAWVTFDTNDPVLKKQQFKGWVQVIR